MSLREINIFWFRRDLRFNDNTALLHALNGNFPVLPVFIFDPLILNKLKNKRDARVQFIYEEVLKLKRHLEDYGASIFIYHDTPTAVFKKLCAEYKIKEVFANRDYEPYTVARDENISRLLSNKKISFQLFKDHILFEGSEILKEDGTPYRVFTPYKRTWLKKLDDLGAIKTDHVVPFERFFKTKRRQEVSLLSVGFEPSAIKIPPMKIRPKLIGEYHLKRDYPALEATSRLGIHLRFGTISIREIVKSAKTYNRTFLNELIWREFYSSILQHYPYVATGAFNKKYELIPWRNDQSEFRKWCAGRTGYPIVDAGMRQLNTTGYMHNRARMITASFLTKHLLIDWRWGAAYFAGRLLDFELASNNGGWQWAAGTGTDAQPYFRIFNPENQARKFDPNSDYIRQWIPEIGTAHYPEPIVEHKFARNRAIETYKRVVSK
ncbi:MAG: DNA photolyase family protein [Cytophagales bacterium]|nr:DNA photolyase family protein [Cytophagales bacterium]